MREEGEASSIVSSCQAPASNRNRSWSLERSRGLEGRERSAPGELRLHMISARKRQRHALIGQRYGRANPFQDRHSAKQ